ncbi:MAG: LysM peptidoglycan-binding domain-containing protein [Treponema sp.]|nr:LysM peptidoglycan-binding domain-containing protein [Treponema sp.]
MSIPSVLSCGAKKAAGVFQAFSNAINGNPRVLRAAGCCCLSVLLLGAAFLVFFAIISPELPPENLSSTLNSASDSLDSPYSSGPFQVVVLPGEDREWPLLSADQEEETGAGNLAADRGQDIEYHIRPGETLSEIAYSYSVSYDILAFYNQITNANRIRVGTVIKIPSLENEKTAAEKMARQPPRQTPARTSTRNVRIAYETQNPGGLNGSAVTIQFSVLDPAAEELQSFEWDFGDGKRGFRPNPIYEYSAPKTYVARLTARDANGTIYRSNPLYIDIPHPASAAGQSASKFVTLSAPDEYFVVNGTITKVARYPSLEAAPLDFSESDRFLTKVRFTKPGFYGLTVLEEGMIEQHYSVFVSPIPTMHADAAQESYNWYRTQFNTGTTSNCGPASASMAIGWSLGKYFPVSAVRQAVGWQGEGGTSLEELLGVIKNNGVGAAIHPLRSAEAVKDVIDSGSIAIVLFHTDGIRTSRADPATDFFGKYYNDSVGHYIVIKGYSLNGEFFVIYDPIPSDWGANSFRYSDDMSMIGRNRYYSSAELLRSLRRAEMIVVPRDK